MAKRLMFQQDLPRVWVPREYPEDQGGRPIFGPDIQGSRILSATNIQGDQKMLVEELRERGYEVLGQYIIKQGGKTIVGFWVEKMSEAEERAAGGCGHFAGAAFALVMILALLLTCWCRG